VNDGPKGPSPQDVDLLRLIFESATDFAVFAEDISGRVIRWNTGAERLTGYSEQEILGETGDIIFTDEDRAAGAPERERSGAILDGRSEDERWHQRKDGSRFWGSGLMMPLQTGDGFVKIMRDRTAHHITEQGLKESEARFRLLALPYRNWYSDLCRMGPEAGAAHNGRFTRACRIWKVVASVG
jgi:PAS domain S-box-containing protein